MLWTATQGADNYQEQEYEWLSILNAGKDVIGKLIKASPEKFFPKHRRRKKTQRENELETYFRFSLKNPKVEVMPGKLEAAD